MGFTSKGVLPEDDNGKPVLGLWNDATKQAVPLHIAKTVVGADGNTYAILDADVTVSITEGQAGFVALVSPPTNTSVGVDTVLTFAQQVNHYRIQNLSPANANIHEDSAATTGTLQLVSGAVYREDKPVTSIHVLTAAAQPINAANGILVEGWL